MAVDHLVDLIVAGVPAMAATTADLVSEIPPTRDREERVVATSKTPTSEKKTSIFPDRCLRIKLNHA